MGGRSIFRSSLPSGRFQSIEGIDCLECFLGGCASGCGDRYYRTSPQVNTPFQNPTEGEPTEIEVTDPCHPLYGRRFPLFTLGHSARSRGFAVVVYREPIRLRLPLSATNLGSPRPMPCSKLTLASVTELLTLVQHCEAVWPLLPTPSGTVLPLTCKPPSVPTSQPSSRR